MHDQIEEQLEGDHYTDDLDESLQSQLIQGIQSLNLECVKDILSVSRVDPDVFLDLDEALISAVKAKQVDIVGLLLAHGASLTYRDQFGVAAIHYACREGCLPVLQLLIESGFDVNLWDEKYWTPMHYACLHCYIEIVDFLLDHGAYVNIPSLSSPGNQESPLHAAIQGGNVEIVQLLINCGAKVNASKLDDGQTPVLMAVNKQQYPITQRLQILQALVKAGGSIHRADKKGRRPLHISVASHPACPEITKFLIEKGASINFTDSSQRTPLCTAVCVANFEDAKILLEAGANPNVVDKKYMSPIHYATIQNSTQLVEMLLEYGAQVDAKTSLKEGTALTIASAMNHRNVLKVLCKAGANVNYRDRELCTPLHKLLGGRVPNKTEAIRVLLEYGAEIDAEDIRGYTPMDRCVFQCVLNSFNIEELKLLVGAGAMLQHKQQRQRQNSPLCWLVWHSELEAATYLINAGWKLSTEFWIFTTQWGPTQKPLLEMILEIMKSPRTLTFLCRQAIREQICKYSHGLQIFTKIDTLELPRSLKSFLKIEQG